MHMHMSVNKRSFGASLGHATQCEKLRSSLGFAYVPKGSSSPEECFFHRHR